MRTLLTLLPACLLFSVTTLHGAALDDAAKGATRYWVGTNGQWQDGANWSDTPQGTGGAGAPKPNDAVVIAANTPIPIELPKLVRCGSLMISGPLRVTAVPGAELVIGGDWRMDGKVEWRHGGTVVMRTRPGDATLDVGGVSIDSDLLVDAAGHLHVRSDLVLAPGRSITLAQGTLSATGRLVQAATFRRHGNAAKAVVLNGSVLMLEQPLMAAMEQLIQQNASVLVMNGQAAPWTNATGEVAAMGDRDINICGTDPGQTPFTVETQVTTSYNGFGVACRGDCNATVTVAANGGSGSFSYNWLTGPPTQTWATACGGPQIVIVTDLVQNISCPVSVTVTEPPPLGVIFLGPGTPPTCHDTCDGTRAAFGVGGVPAIVYNWNNGAGTQQSFNQLCNGDNTLVVSDQNGCSFDTTFTYNVPPITPNLSFTHETCFGGCDGTAQVAPAGGTGGLGVVWQPGGATSPQITGLCAGDWNVTITDANGCDTTVVFTIDPAEPFDIAFSSTDESCFGACDGAATVDISGGSGTFTYEWTPPPGDGEGTNSVTGLCADTYTVLISDPINGCDSLVTIVIGGPAELQVAATMQDVSCATSCDGSISLVVSGGTGTPSFTWSPEPVPGQGTANVGPLCPGEWTVVITDAAGCDTTLTYTIQAPPPFEITSTFTDVTCAGACDGTASVTIDGGTPDYDLLWSPLPGLGQGSTTATQMCAAAYTLLITDDNGCDTTLVFTIDEPDPLQASFTIEPISCPGACDAVVTVTAEGGVPELVYLWVPAPLIAGQGTPVGEGFCAGVVNLTITDGNDCELVVPITIQEPDPLVLDLQVTPATCPNTCDGTAQVTVSGGTGDLVYIWEEEPGTGQNTNSVTGLCAQTYTLTVRDEEDCEVTTTFTVTSPDPIVVDAAIDHITCAGDCDGAITLDVSGGAGNFTFDWTGSPVGDGTPSVTGLCAGLWAVTIASGACDTTLVFDVTQEDPLLVDVTTTPLGCSGTCDGTATVTISGGAEPYTITWDPPPPANPEPHIATGYCPGAYQVTVEDSLGCTITLPFTIADTQPITVDLTLTEAGCGSECNGTASVVLGGTIGLVEYTWNPPPGGNGQGTPSVDGLCPGPYTLHILDTATGCDTLILFTIVQPFAITAMPDITDGSCHDSCDGEIQVDVIGGIGQLGFVWTPPVSGQGTPHATGLCPGVYSLLITDSQACDTTLTMTVGAPQPLDATATITQASCGGQCEGIIQVSPSGGSGGFQYFWSPLPGEGQGTDTASELCPGIWNVTITDQNGCDSTFTYLLEEPEPLAVDLAATASECQLCNGGAQVTISGGTSAILVVWTNAAGDTIAIGDHIANVCAGIYNVTVTDGAGCTVTLPVHISDTDGETITTTNGSTTCPDSCDGSVSVDFACSEPDCTIAWTDVDGNDVGTTAMVGNLCEGTYNVVVTNGPGCISIGTAVVASPEPLSVSMNVSPAACAGSCDGSIAVSFTGGTPSFTLVWSPPPGAGQGTPYASELCADTYTLSITDGVGCTTVATAEVTEPPPLALSAQVTPAGCTGECNGSITLFSSGGTGTHTIIWDPVPPNGQGVTNAQFLCAGEWTATVYDANGCFITQTWTILSSAGPVLTGSATPSHCAVCDGTASVVATAGAGPYTYAWSMGGIPFGTTPTIADLCAGVYQVMVTDSAGCTTSTTVTVSDEGGEELTMTNGGVNCIGDCNGVVAVAFDCTTPLCTITWLNDAGLPIATGTNTLSGLCEGTYHVSVTNGAGCTTLGSAMVITNTQIVSNVTVTGVSCPGVCDGTATADASGGTATYSYFWEPEPIIGQHTPQVTDLCAGAYKVTIIDFNGCALVDSLTVPGPAPITIEGVILNAACSGACDGAITAFPSGGTNGFTYVWSPEPDGGQGTAHATGLCPGLVTLTVTDANGCTGTASWTIGQPDPITIDFNTVPSICGVCTGEATTEATGGAPGYTWFWLMGNDVMGTGPSITGLCAGLYTVVATDANGCQAGQLVPVEDEDGEETTATDGEVTCPGDCDGTASVATPCVDGPCTIDWYDDQGTALGQTGTDAVDLCPGLYLALVTNASGCISIDTAMVYAPDPVVANLTTTPVTCFGDCDGTATVAPSGGAGNYSIEWVPAPDNGQGGTEALELCAGETLVIVTDSVGCSVSTPVIVTGPGPLEATAQIIGPGCPGECNGSITLDVTGGNGGNTFVWSPEVDGQGTNTASALCPGTYRVTITDANGCTVSYTYTLDEPVDMSIGVDLVHNTCQGDCQGAAQITITGGTPGHAIVWNGPNGVIAQDVMGVNGLCAGTYTVNVADANACTIEETFVITQGDAILPGLTFIGETCNGPCDGEAVVDPSGGAGGTFTILWMPSGETTLGVNGLCAGEHTVTITDAIGCDTTITFIILPWTPITDNAVVTDVACTGDCSGSITLAPAGGIGTYGYAWIPDPGFAGPVITGQCAGEYQVTITDAVGCGGTFNYTISEPAEVLSLVVDAVTSASCSDSDDGAITISLNGGVAGYTISWTGPDGYTNDQEDISGLFPGTYTATVTDANGCTITQDVIVDALQGVVADAGAGQQQCAGVAIVLNGSGSLGATTYVWTDEQGDEVGTGAIVTVEDLGPGTHTFTLTASDGPCSDTDQVIIVVFTQPVADAGPDQTIFVDDQASLGGSPTGPPGSSFVWAPDSVLTSSTASNPTAFPTTTTWFVVTVTTPDGCTAQDSVLVTVMPEVDIPSGFTPNGDGWNDTWIIGLIELFPQCEVEIYNRWGEMLFRSVGYNIPWDGRYDGSPVPVGTYYYVIQLNDERFPEAYTGPLTIIR